MASTAAVRSSNYLTSDVPVRSERRASETSRGASLNTGTNTTRESVQGVAQRIAARINAANINPAEIASLEEEHRHLAMKKFSGEFTKADQRRLNFVRWSLDRIQDARHGFALDELERAVEIHERVGLEVNRLVGELNNFARRGARR